MNKKIQTLEDMFLFETSLEESRDKDRDIFIKKPRLSHYKIIKSGNVFEIYHSKHIIGYNLTSSNRENKPGGTHKKNIHRNSIKRSRDAVARIINANVWTYKDSNNEIYTPQFITLTFKENITNIENTNYYYNKFIKRLNYQLLKQKRNKIQYINIIEFQKKGRIHFHAIFFNLFLLEHERTNRWLAMIWSHGFIEVEPLKKSKDIAGYLTKYLTKDTIDERLLTKKKYYCSRGIKRPIVITDEEMAQHIITQLQTYKIDYQNEHTTPTGNVISYKKYVLEDEEIGKYKKLSS